MGANPPLPSADVDAEKNADSEYNTLLDLNEKHEYPADKPDTCKEEAVDIEAGHPKPETDEAPTPKPPRAPLSREEALALRIKPMDNIRTFALSLILLQNAAIQAVSTHRDAANIHETWPKSFVLISLFVGMTRLLAVPLLFFVAGFSSHFTMVVHGQSPIRFALRRTWKTTLAVILYQSFAYLAKLVHPLPPAETAATTPYYASREGILAVLNGPTAYVLAVLALDYIYAIFRSANLFLSRPNKPTHFITTKTRYYIAQGLFIVVEMWVLWCGFGLARMLLPAGSTAERWLYAANGAELHFPFLYLVAYTAGVHFVHYYKFILEGNTRSSPAKRLGVYLALAVAALYWIRHAFPGALLFLDVRERPALGFHPLNAACIYAVWVGHVLMMVPEAVVGVFFTRRALAMDWGNFSRTAHFQVYVQMLYVVGNQVRFFDNVFWRWVFLGWMGMYYAHYGGIGTIALGNLVKRGWFAVRRRLGRKGEQPISV